MNQKSPVPGTKRQINVNAEIHRPSNTTAVAPRTTKAIKQKDSETPFKNTLSQTKSVKKMIAMAFSAETNKQVL